MIPRIMRKIDPERSKRDAVRSDAMQAIQQAHKALDRARRRRALLLEVQLIQAQRGSK